MPENDEPAVASAATVVNFEDGMAVSEIVYGDGSMPPFLHLGLTNIDPQAPNGVKIALSHDEALLFGTWLIQQAHEMPMPGTPAPGGPS